MSDSKLFSRDLLNPIVGTNSVLHTVQIMGRYSIVDRPVYFHLASRYTATWPPWFGRFRTDDIDVECRDARREDKIFS